ncbi:extracellular solute-binding protein, family 3 [Novosphingobium nitrogenifigens DSM 19370]|uniref:Extracellular solute-binding protein, family 3 n=2 Tax=Novosphingobium nitrogenifigens TaxID=378548 RepID=F1ZB06_9SPHN|nr:extracellular solute-binding protein, family 3 [Novosphingobium nitrogenifigens DSM 19370]
MARRAFLAGALTAATAVALPRQAEAAPLAKVRETGVLRVAVYADNRPWSWVEGGVVRGIDADLARAMAEKIGVRAEVIAFMPGDDIAADLRNTVWRGGLLGFQVCDVMMHVPFDRQIMIENDQVAILGPYYREGFAMACGNEQSDCEVPPAQLHGRRLAAETATVSDEYLLTAFGGVLRNDVHHYRGGYEATEAVVEGKADAVLATRAQVEAALHDRPQNAVHRRKGPIPALFSPGWDIAMAVKDNSRTLGDLLENSIVEMTKNGRIESIFAQYGVAWHAAVAA